jgi:lipoprotein-releasing system permease protein
MMFLSIRHLLTRKKQSLLILLGIVIGTTAYVAISGMMLGFQTKLMDQLVNNDAHVRISAREDLLTPETMGSFPSAKHVFWAVPPSGRKDSAKIEYPLGWFQKLDADPEVTAYSPQVNLNVILKRGQVVLTGRLVGSDPLKQEKVSNIKSYMVDGEFKDMGNSGNRLVIGRALMNNLGARKSETILISSGSAAPQPFKIVAIFETGIKNIDEGTVFTNLTDAQKLRGTPSEITDIAVRLEDPFKVELKADQWKNNSNEKVLSWKEASASILSVFKTQDIVRNSMTISIILVAGFGIYNILSILVNQKRRDIAILRSMGYSPNDILKLFFYQGLIMGVIGGFVGLLFGLGMSLLMEQIEIPAGRMSTTSTHMIISFDAIIYVKAISLALTSSIFSSILPARAAGKLEPMDIIRSGGE